MQELSDVDISRSNLFAPHDPHHLTKPGQVDAPLVKVGVAFGLLHSMRSAYFVQVSHTNVFYRELNMPPGVNGIFGKQSF